MNVISKLGASQILGADIFKQPKTIKHDQVEINTLSKNDNGSNIMKKFLLSSGSIISGAVYGKITIEKQTQQRIKLIIKTIIAISLIISACATATLLPPLIPMAVPIVMIILILTIRFITTAGADVGYDKFKENTQKLIDNNNNHPSCSNTISETIFNTIGINNNKTKHWIKFTLATLLIGGIVFVSLLFPPISFSLIGIIFIVAQIIYSGIFGVVIFNKALEISVHNAKQLFLAYKSNKHASINIQENQLTTPENKSHKYAWYCFLYFFNKKYAPHLKHHTQTAIDAWRNIFIRLLGWIIQALMPRTSLPINIMQIFRDDISEDETAYNYSINVTN